MVRFVWGDLERIRKRGGDGTVEGARVKREGAYGGADGRGGTVARRGGSEGARRDVQWGEGCAYVVDSQDRSAIRCSITCERCAGGPHSPARGAQRTGSWEPLSLRERGCIVVLRCALRCSHLRGVEKLAEGGFEGICHCRDVLELVFLVSRVVASLRLTRLSLSPCCVRLTLR